MRFDTKIATVVTLMCDSGLEYSSPDLDEG